MKHLLLLFIFLSTIGTFAQERYKERENETTPKVSGIVDRAGGIHNASNIGLFFENRGKLYPRRITQGPSGEFPINSTMHYIFRVNPMVGIKNNVVQARFTENEEWEAIGGLHNPELSQIAMSDNPRTWHPENGWPLKDAEGNNIFKSDQDSYCEYSDSNNSRAILNIKVAQTGYAYGVSFAKNMLFYKYEITVTEDVTYDDLYFALYADIDVGNISGGVPEYGDDKIGFDKEKNFLYFHDDGVSTEWPGNKTGYFGVAFLKTPEINGKEAGITDMHYNLYYDDEDIDSIQYGIMSSSQSLYNSAVGKRYFHLGDNEGLNYDDPSTIPNDGLDLVANVSSGPYTISVGDTLRFYTVFLASDNYDGIMAEYASAKKIMDFNFEISQPPVAPNLSGISGDMKNFLFWDDRSESSKDNFSASYDFEGYRLYRSQDNGVTWTMLEEYDKVNNNGFDVGLEYSYVDSTVTNGFEYWYSITAYDKGDSAVTSLESPKGNTTDSPNLITLTPLSAAAGYEPVSAYDPQNIGTGESNYSLKVNPVDDENLAGNTYDVGFTYVASRNRTTMNTEVEIIIRDSSETNMNNYGMQFIAPNKLHLIDLQTGDYIEPTPKSYISGAKYNLNSGLAVSLTDPDPTGDAMYLPQNGDYLTINFGTYAIKNSDKTVIEPRPFIIGKKQSTYDGVTFTLNEPNPIRNISRIGGSDAMEITFDVYDETLLTEGMWFVRTTGNGTDGAGTGFISIAVFDQNDESIAAFDTVYALDYIEFLGIEGKVDFNPDSPPSVGNIYSITSIVPSPPDIRDKYQFSIQGSKIDKEKLETDLQKIRVVPNPYVVSSLYEPEFGELRREPLRQIQFINLPNECTIHIFTVDADKVKTLYHNSTTGTEIWDLRAEGGREVAPGVYIYVVEGDGIEYKNRFAIIK